MVSTETLKKEIFSKTIKTGDIILAFNKRVTKKENNELKGNLKSIYPAGSIRQKYHNYTTGEQSFVLEDVVRDEKYALFEKGKHSVQNGYYLEYDEKNECVYIIFAKIRFTNHKKGQTNEWTPYCTIRINKNKTAYATSVAWNSHYSWVGYEYGSDVKQIWSFSEVFANNCWQETQTRKPVLINRIPGKTDKELFMGIFSNIFPNVVTLESNNMKALDTLEVLNQFIKYVEPTRSNGPKQKRINDLILKKLPEPCFTQWPDINLRVANLCKVEDRLCCLRTFVGNGKEFVEGGRVYISNEEVIACKKNNFGHYVNTTLTCNMYNWQYSLDYIEKGCTKGTKAEYIEDIGERCDGHQKTQAIISVLHYPIIEKIYRYGKQTEDLAIKAAVAIGPKDQIKAYLGPMDTSKKSLFATFGVNKYQFQKLANENMLYELRKLRYIFSSNNTSAYDFTYSNEKVDISFIDNKTFDRIYEAFKESLGSSSYYLISECMKDMYNAYGLEVFCNAIGEIKRAEEEQNIFIAEDKETGRYGRWQEYPLRLYSDYLHTVNLLGDAKNFRPYFKTRDEIAKMHDAAVLCYNLKRNSIKEAAFKSVVGRWDKFEFSPLEDQFAIVAPKKAEEIAAEGILLHHCVKTYIDRVIAKSTNILFLRKKDEIEKPFFTIELDNNNIIQQVHGFGNSNLEEDSEELAFIKKWAKEKKLKLSNFNKVR